MIYNYKALTNTGEKKEGTIDAVSKDLAISALQRRNLVVLSVLEDTGKGKGLKRAIFQKVKMKEVVILSRQISTLFEAQVSALKAFSLMASNTENPLLQKKLNQITDDLQAGFSISGALAKHPDVFSDFYVNMVKAGEESGKLNQTFVYLADYLDREYELTSKTRNALVYPAFVVIVFIVVMALMFTMVIPKLSAIIADSGLEVPLYTKIVIGVSNFFVDYGLLLVIFFVIGIWYLWQMHRSEAGQQNLDKIKLQLPGFGDLFKKLYLSRIADNLDTMLTAGIPIVRAIEITSQVVGNKVYRKILEDAMESVKGGSALSKALDNRPNEIPGIMVQMAKVGEETGSLGNILKTLAKFYKREVNEAVDTLVGLIEPAMIVGLGVGVGVLLASILVPIYNIASSIQ